ncbi:hypothetical protein LAZ67_1004109 [Cordylochernes scorpioides]|uniref:Uncharacterized protein n=1 Tax=Cordylochernes scorpioides TaxID=51811 RepID=A0ABY6JXE6_9ARAC|nr:hypothetical protein LAZ67_1004109 [Cordylochernes scorpioides]
MSKRSPGGSLYFVSFKDDFSRFRVAYFIRHKSDVLEKFKEFVKRVRTETGNKIKRFRTDNGTEFLNKNFSDYLKSLGIVHELTAPYTPEQNGISERDNRTIVESARCLLHGRKMPLELWAEAVNTAVYLLNRCTTKVLGNSTPYEIWYKRKPSILHLKTFGCNAYVHIPKDNRKKLDKKSIRTFFVGYTETNKNYRMWDPIARKIIISRDVIFTEANTSENIQDNQQEQDDQEIEEMNKIPYRQTIGSLMYLMTGTRPDIAYAVSRVSQFMNNPGPSHWTAVKKIFGYLKATKNISICFGGSSCTTSLIGFSDADFAADIFTKALPPERYRRLRSQLGLSETTESTLVNGKEICFKLDSGAEVKVLPYTFTRQMKGLEIFQTNRKLTSYTGHEIMIKGIATLNCKTKNKTESLEFLIADGYYQPILGMEAIENLSLIKRCDAVQIQQNNSAKEILNRHKNIFEGIGRLPIEHKIRLNENTTPVIAPSRKIPFSIREKVRAELERMEKLDIIEKVEEPSEWTHPIVVVQKPSGDVRICMDPRELNKYVQRERYILPTVETIFSELKEKFIRTNYRIMEEYMVKLQEEDKLIWDLMIDDEDNTSRELEEEQDTVIQYKEKWLNLEIKIGEFLNPLTQKYSLNETRACRLPKLELKIFDGTRLEWLGWWAQFSTIHEDSRLSDVDKLQYLVQAIKEDTRASRLVKSFPLTADNYPKIIAALKDRFGDRVILTEIYVRELLGLVINNARRTTMTIENLYDKLESYLRSLKSLGVTQDQNATFLYSIVESSLPEELIQVWQRSSISGYYVEGEDKPQSINQRLGSLFKFLRQEVKGEERGHWLLTCQRWLAMPVKERRELLGRHKACFHCLRVGHYGRHCRKVNAQIYGVNSIKGEEARELAHFVIKPLGKEKWELPLQALLVNKMTGLLPGRDLCLPLSEELRSAQLADPQFEKSGKVDLILGADVYGSILLPEIRRCKKTQLCAQNTRLGWILSGRLTGGDILGTTQVFSTHVQYEDNMEVILNKFWEVEEVRLTIKTTPEDEFCGALYKTEVKRTSSGRYNVPLPFDPKLAETELLGGSFATCVQRQIALERRLEKDEILRQKYRSFMGEYAELGHMTSLSEQSEKDEKGCCFIPHHAVRKNQPNKGKIRVVFNASTKTSNGFSFNERLYTGPKLQTDIFTILIKWRQYKVVVLTDIEKMYRQILTLPARYSYLWNFPCSFPGTPNLIAIGTGRWKQISESSGGNKERDISVDDIITGAETSMKALNLRDELIGLLKGGGFVLKKWASNDPAILKDITEESRLQLIMFEDTEVVKTLEVGWNPKEDCFVYNLQCTSATEEFTKRRMLSFVAKLYDPVGWLAPVIIVGKTMIQQLWVTGEKWDEPIDFTIKDLWRKFWDELKYFRSIRIPRWLGLEGTQEIHLHDSTVTLNWIKTLSRALPTFIGNRVAEIQACRQIREWRYVPSGDNPADIASRGILGSQLNGSMMWWNGPTWLA